MGGEAEMGTPAQREKIEQEVKKIVEEIFRDYDTVKICDVFLAGYEDEIGKCEVRFDLRHFYKEIGTNLEVWVSQDLIIPFVNQESVREIMELYRAELDNIIAEKDEAYITPEAYGAAVALNNIGVTANLVLELNYLKGTYELEINEWDILLVGDVRADITINVEGREYNIDYRQGGCVIRIIGKDWEMLAYINPYTNAPIDVFPLLMREQGGEWHPTSLESFEVELPQILLEYPDDIYIEFDVRQYEQFKEALGWEKEELIREELQNLLYDIKTFISMKGDEQITYGVVFYSTWERAKKLLGMNLDRNIYRVLIEGVEHILYFFWDRARLKVRISLLG